MAASNPPKEEARAAPSIIQTTLTVKRKEWITPHFLRVFLTGDDIPLFANSTVGLNNKIFIPPEGARAVSFPRFENGKRIMPDEGERPIIRTFTHRGIDLEAKELWIDFVIHGDEGRASSWALRAEPGDILGVAMKGGPGELAPAADEYVLVGDATALPVLGAILESLPASARATVVLEVHGTEDEQPLETQAQAEFHWLHNPEPARGSRLPERVRDLVLPAAGVRRFAYVAAELRAVKAIRQHLRVEAGWDKKELYAYSYWKADTAEDASESERRAERNSV